MASWGSKRRNLIIIIFFVIVVAFFSTTSFNLFYKAPTCFDNKQNGGEFGIDCGGECTALCPSQVSPIVVKWSRFFEVAPGVYNTIAYIENQNPSAGINNLDYTFKLYTDEGVSVAKESGSIDVRPNQVTAVIENNLNTGELKANKITFEYEDNPKWIRQEPLEKLVTISDQKLFEVDNLPRVNAKVTNNTIDPIKNLKFVVIVYDGLGNAVGSSNTFVDRLNKDESRNLIFTWPKRFSETGSRFEILPIYDIGN